MILATVSQIWEIVGEITFGMILAIPLLYIVLRSDKKGGG